MNDKVNGFVLTESEYKESDTLLQVLTKEYGILSMVAKAAKKLNSKNHFLPTCLYEFIIDYKDNKTIYTVHGHKLLENYFESENIEMMSFKNILIELTIKNRDIPTYDNLCFVFKELNKLNKNLLGSMYVSYLIKEFGITPVVDNCAMCDSKKVVGISNRHGGFLCINHIGHEETVSVERLKKFRLMIKGSFENYDILKYFDYEFIDFSLLMDFFLSNSDLRIKAYEFYRSLM